MSRKPNGPPSPETEVKSPREWFRQFAAWTARAAGSGWAFALAVTSLVLWAASRPLFAGPQGFDTWQLIINTATTIVTFLMVFLIQSTQNRDAKALHLKLDELIRAVKGARNRLVELENCTDEELEQLQQEFQRLRQEAQRRKTSVTAAADTPPRRDIQDSHAAPRQGYADEGL